MNWWKGRKNNSQVKVGFWGTQRDTLEYRDNRKIQVGVTHEMLTADYPFAWMINENVPNHPTLCKMGMHACPKPHHVSEFAGNSTRLYLVIVAGDITDIEYSGDKCKTKFCGRVRTYMGFIEPKDLPSSNQRIFSTLWNNMGYPTDTEIRFGWYSPNFNRAVRNAFNKKYPQHASLIKETI